MSHASAVPVDELNERYLCHPRRKPWPSTSGSAPASRKQAGKKQGQKRQRPVAQSRNGGRRGREQGHRDHDRVVDPAWCGIVVPGGLGGGVSVIVGDRKNNVCATHLRIPFQPLAVDQFVELGARGHVLGQRERDTKDRKSTRLNSSHLVISYAVFC